MNRWNRLLYIISPCLWKVVFLLSCVQLTSALLFSNPEGLIDKAYSIYSRLYRRYMWTVISLVTLILTQGFVHVD